MSPPPTALVVLLLISADRLQLDRFFLQHFSTFQSAEDMSSPPSARRYSRRCSVTKHAIEAVFKLSAFVEQGDVDSFADSLECWHHPSPTDASRNSARQSLLCESGNARAGNTKFDDGLRNPCTINVLKRGTDTPCSWSETDILEATTHKKRKIDFEPCHPAVETLDSRRDMQLPSCNES